jgi:uncharacterized protein (TIRG00374 family)
MAATSQRQLGSTLRSLAGWGIAIACLAWLFHGIHFERLLSDVGRINWWWIAAGVILDIVAYWIQGVRWALLLHPLGRLSSMRTTQAIYAGLFTNEVLPLRVGEVVRMYLVSRWLHSGFTTALPSLLIERLFDGVWLVVGIGITALCVTLPAGIMEAADILGGALIAAVIVLTVILFVQVKRPAGSTAAKQGAIAGFFNRILSGIRAIGLTRDFWISFQASGLIVVCQIFSFWLVMIGYGIHISLWAGAAVLIIEHLGTMVPNAPSNLGTYQFFTVLGLALFGIDKTTATGFSMVVFIVLTAPLWLLGLVAISKTGMTLRQIRDEIASIRSRERTGRVTQ